MDILLCLASLCLSQSRSYHTTAKDRGVRVGRQLTAVGTTGSFETAWWWRGRFRPLGPRTGQPDVWGALALAVEAWCEMKMREDKLDY
jgi:hypothetical protein